jgi:threonine dehydrogenase-like Zn-dependent dehydrogenase/quercetin dioxygenase-like cupin family protein
MEITRNSIETTRGPSDWFSGTVFIDTIAAAEPLSSAAVHFTPGARTAWHTHPRGQTIFVTEGIGLCQRDGGSIEVIRPGDRVFFEPGENHWHGAAPTRFMTHIAMQLADESGSPVTWGEHVSDEEYGQAPGDRGEPVMRGTVMYAAGDVRIENVPDPKVEAPTDAVIRVTRACICGSDLWPYKNLQPDEGARVMGHEAIGVVEEIGRDVRTVKVSDLVVMPFAFSDGTCLFCEEGLQTECIHGGFFGNPEVPGAQSEAVRVPQADGTLYVLPVSEDDALMPSLLTLSDVMGTGHHAAVVAKVGPGATVAVVGDGAVGLCGVIAAKRLGADQIIIMGRHEDRIALASDFGATEVVSERGEEAFERVKALADGRGVHAVLECVGLDQSMETAIEIARPGGAVGRVGVPQHEAMPAAQTSFFKNVTIGGGPAPVRAYIDELLPDILEGRIEPGRVFDRTVDLDGVPEGYRAMNDRESIKVLVKP